MTLPTVAITAIVCLCFHGYATANEGNHVDRIAVYDDKCLALGVRANLGNLHDFSRAEVLVYGLQEKKLRFRISEAANPRFVEKGTLLVCDRGDSRYVIHDARSGVEVSKGNFPVNVDTRVLPNLRDTVVFSTNIADEKSRFVFVGDTMRTPVLWRDAAKPVELRKRLGSEGGWYSALTPAPPKTDKLLALWTGSNDEMGGVGPGSGDYCEIYDISKGELLRSIAIAPKKSSVWAIDLSQDGHVVAALIREHQVVGKSDGLTLRCKYFDLRDKNAQWSVVRSFQAADEILIGPRFSQRIAFSSDSAKLAIATGDDNVDIVDLCRPTNRKRLSIASARFLAVQWIGDSNNIIAVTDGGNIAIGNVDEGKIERVLYVNGQ